MSLNIHSNYNQKDECWEVELVGEIDIHSKSHLKEVLLELDGKKSCDFLFHCESLDYIDSTGLGVLISFYKNVKEHEHQIAFTALKPSILKVFSLTGLDKIFSIR